MASPIAKPPRAEKRPRVETWHGHEKRDDYHWLKAENWQEVMHDPSLLPADIRAFLEGENAYHEAVMADTRRCVSRAKYWLAASGLGPSDSASLLS